MKSFAKVTLLAALFATANACGASAQAWGPAVDVKILDPVVRAAAEVMGMVRTRAMVVGQVNLPEYVGKGTMIDLEAASRGSAVEVSRYSYAVSIHGPASRLDFEGPATPRTIRVVKVSRAWDESWSADKTRLNTSPSNNAVNRAQMIWLQPHAFVHAAAFASGKKCLDGRACTPPLKIGTEGGKTVIEIEVNGVPYKAMLGADKRPERIEAMIAQPVGGAKKVVAAFADFRTGEKTDAGFGLAEGKQALDKYHTGTYWPSRVSHEVDGVKVLDLTITEGWANPYVVFPDPELLAKGQ